MKEKNLYQALSEEFENDIEYKIEYKILEITEQICSVMKERQITRAELSRKLGTSKTAVTKMLDGSTNFTLKRLIKIADVLEKELDIHLTRDPGEVQSQSGPAPEKKWKTQVFSGSGRHRTDQTIRASRSAQSVQSFSVSNSR